MRAFRLLFAIAAAATFATGLAGCSSTIHDQARIGGVDTLSLDAKQRLVIFGKDRYTGQPVVCAEPSPDALVAIAASFAGQGSGTPQGGNQIQAAVAASSSESAASIGLRTATIQALRDGYYRLCEGYINGVIDKQDYYDTIRGVDIQMAAMMSMDALSGMRTAPGVAISAGGTSASTDGTTTADTTAPASTVEAAARTAAGGNILLASGDHAGTAYQAVAVSNVFNRFMDYKERVWNLRSRAGGDTAAQPTIVLPPCPPTDAACR
jgi:hypothetical protein